MNVLEVQEEIGTKLATIVGLRVFEYTVDSVAPPGAIVGLPETITFDETYGRGSDSMTLPLWVMVALSSDRAANAELAAYLDGSGAKSVKATVDGTNANTYTSCDTVTITTAEPDYYTSGGVEMLGAKFTVVITGSGS